jgi:hypothetical protein
LVEVAGDALRRGAANYAAIAFHKPAPAFPAAMAFRAAFCFSCFRPYPDEAICMFPKPKPVLAPNTYAYESEPMVKATGFREYDARWLFGKEINLMGIQALGMGLGT